MIAAKFVSQEIKFCNSAFIREIRFLSFEEGREISNPRSVLGRTLEWKKRAAEDKLANARARN